MIKNLFGNIFTKKWNIDRDIVHKDEEPLFTIKELGTFLNKLFYVNTKKGVIYQCNSNGKYEIKLKNRQGSTVMLQDAFVAAFSTDKTCFIVHSIKNKNNYLIDTRGEFYALPKVDNVHFFGPGQYEMYLDKDTGKYLVRDGLGEVIVWEIKAMDLSEVQAYAKETVPFEKSKVSSPAKKFIRKLKQENERNEKYLYFCCRSDKQSAIAEWMMSKELPFERIPAIFEDDDSVNIRIKIDSITTQNEDILFLATKYTNSYSIYNIPIRWILSALNNRYHFSYRFEFALPKLKESQIVMCRRIINTIKVELNYQSEEELCQKFIEPLLFTFYQRINLYKNSGCSYFYIPTSDGEVEPIKNPFADKEKSLEYESNLLAEMLANGIKVSKWSNETDMYILIRKHFPDAIYQYKSSWLGKQSLDVFVPSLNVAFEYQGIQHFEPIEYFGGVEGLNEVIKRDQRKMDLCITQDIRLIYWNYDEPITAKILNEKLDTVKVQSCNR